METKETLGLNFCHPTANGKLEFSVSGFMLAICPYLVYLVRG